MPSFLEDKLKAEYGQKSVFPYKIMNAQGAMHGNRETAKGRAMELKHERDAGHKHVKNPQGHQAKLKHG